MSTGLEASTVTPGRTAPEASRIVPVIDDCAWASDGSRAISATTARQRTSLTCMHLSSRYLGVTVAEPGLTLPGRGQFCSGKQRAPNSSFGLPMDQGVHQGNYGKIQRFESRRYGGMDYRGTRDPGSGNSGSVVRCSGELRFGSSARSWCGDSRPGSGIESRIPDPESRPKSPSSH